MRSVLAVGRIMYNGLEFSKVDAMNTSDLKNRWMPFALGAMICFWTSYSSADPGELQTSKQTIYDATSCPQIFGTKAVRQKNAERRAHLIETIVQTKAGYRIVHHKGSWVTPTPVRLKDLEIVGTLRTEHETKALVKVRRAQSSQCAPGIYAVGQDGALGQLGRIVSVEKKMLLLDAGEDLAVIPVKGNLVPKIESVWRSAYSVVPSGVGGGGKVGSSAAVARSADGAAELAPERSPTGRESAAKAKAVRSEIKPRTSVQSAGGRTPKISPPSRAVK